MSIGGLVAYEVGDFVVDDVEVGDWLCNLFSPHPFGKLRAGSNPLPRGEGTLDGGFVPALPLWIPACAGKTVRGGFAFGVGEAVLDQVFCCFHSMTDFDARCFALHCVDKELCDGVSILGEADDVLL